MKITISARQKRKYRKSYMLQRRIDEWFDLVKAHKIKVHADGMVRYFGTCFPFRDLVTGRRIPGVPR